MANERGQYGTSSEPSRRSITPWLLGGVGLAAVGLAMAGAQSRRPRLTAHEKEVRAWQAEFPGLPWYADEVRDSRQMDTWERARDHWERTH